MNLNLLAAPLIILSLTIVAVVASPPSLSLDRFVTFADGPTSTPAPTDTPLPTATATRRPLPDGPSGRLTIRRGSELLTLEAPAFVEIARRPDTSDVNAAVSADGQWKAALACGETSCDIIISERGGKTRAPIRVGGYVDGIEWSPAGARLAYGVTHGGGVMAMSRELVVLDGPFAEPRVVLESSGPFATRPFAWLARGELLVALNGDGSTPLVRLAMDGSQTRLATAGTSIAYFYPSPDRTRFAFTQSDERGWRLAAFDLESNEVRDYGKMGSDLPGTPVQVEQIAPEQKTSMYVSWSRDSTKLAFGGGYQPPYTMTIVDVVSGAVTRTEFPYGYPGEIAWSPDGSTVAVSTYDANRTRHEVYLVDPSTGASRHMIAGCVIVWSPDGRFLALHTEQADGVAIMDVATGEYGPVGETSDAPVAWE